MLLRLATDEDVGVMARLSAAAFVADPIETYLYPGRREYFETFVDTQETLLRQSFDRPCGSAILVALEPGDEGWKDGSEIFGFCVFTRETRRRRRRGPKNAEARPSATNAKKATREWDPVLSLMEANHPMVSVTNSKAMIETCETNDSHEWVDDGFKKPKERYELCDLGVHPDFRRRGIGRMMVRWIMDKALGEGVPVHTTASPDGKQLYQSLGFRTVGKWKWCPEPNSEWDVMHWNPPTAEDNGEGGNKSNDD